MTTALQVIDGDRGESPNEVAARRIRQELAGQTRPPSQTAIAAKIGMKQQALSRRLLGQVPFDLNELYAVCGAAGLDTFYVLTGQRETPRPKDPNEGPRVTLLPHLDSNQKPADYSPAISPPAGNVFPLRPNREPDRELAAVI